MDWSRFLPHPAEYNLEELRELDATAIHILYVPGEGGWAKKLDDHTAVITNVPLTRKLMPFDVVTLKPAEGGGQQVDRIVWRAFDVKTGIKYPKPYEKNFDRISQAFRDKGLVVEGFVNGSMGVAHRRCDNLRAILEDAGIDTSEIEFRDW